MEELEELGIRADEEPSGAVRIRTDTEGAAQVLTWSRIGGRLLLPLREFAAHHRAMLYDQVRRVHWSEWFPPERTIAVYAHGSPGRADFSLDYATLRIKDAVCDAFRKRGLPRPDVDRNDPDVRIEAFFFRGRCELSLDVTGVPMHRRGYRPESGPAPLREDRAAALLRFAGYTGAQPLVDPCCGGGTLPIEAALVADRRAPGLLRPGDSYPFGTLVAGGGEALARVRERAQGTVTPVDVPIRGSDRDPDAVGRAIASATRAGCERIAFAVADVAELDAPGFWIVSNPPYGERLEDREAARETVHMLATRARAQTEAARLALVLPAGELEAAVGLRPDRRATLASAGLKLRLLRYPLYGAGAGAGS